MLRRSMRFADALEVRGLNATAVYVPSLKAPDAAEWLRDELKRMSPSVIINATAFAARDGAEGSPLDAADCPVLQVALANLPRRFVGSIATRRRRVRSRDACRAAGARRPVVCGRDLVQGTRRPRCACLSLVRHMPYEHGIAHVADLAAAWARLRATPRSERRVGLMLSTYPGRPDQIAHAVGLDGFESALRIADCLAREGYDVADLPDDVRVLVLGTNRDDGGSMAGRAYRQAFEQLPQPFRDSRNLRLGHAGE